MEYLKEGEAVRFAFFFFTTGRGGQYNGMTNSGRRGGAVCAVKNGS